MADLEGYVSTIAAAQAPVLVSICWLETFAAIFYKLEPRKYIAAMSDLTPQEELFVEPIAPEPATRGPAPAWRRRNRCCVNRTGTMRTIR